jgi:hypothetical protein
MGEAYSAHGGDENRVKIFVGKREGKGREGEGREDSKLMGVNGRIILKWIVEKLG